MSALLSLKGLTAGYGGVPIIEDIELDVAEHEVAVIIGPNGAGKSTLLKSIFALTTVSSGTICLRGPRYHHPSRRHSWCPWGLPPCRKAAMCFRRSPWRKISTSAPMRRHRKTCAPHVPGF